MSFRVDLILHVVAFIVCVPIAIAIGRAYGWCIAVGSFLLFLAFFSSTIEVTGMARTWHQKKNLMCAGCGKALHASKVKRCRHCGMDLR
ncbi:MAG: hypothetical protein ACE37H_09740 [Phycisphaeraceae bacterium]